MVISEDVSFVSSLIDLSKKENIVLLVQPQNASGRLLETASETASLVWLWTSLSTGGSPIDNQRGKSKVVIPSPTCSAETGVFWDLDDCPIPDDLTPALIYDNIKVALKNVGYNGKVSIVAYSVANQTKEDFDFVNIKLINPGTSQEKVNMMFKDVYMWGINHRDEPTNLMVISKDISQDVDFVSALVQLSKKENNILLAHPRNTSGVLLRTASSVWLWTSLSTGGSPLDNQQSSEVATTSPTCSASRKRSSLSVANKQKKRRTKPLHKKRKSRANPNPED
ncbi:NYN domain limkain-b1-type [Arabidopsis suecica]|uniref:NYN domain limkain-b1-type n=1 Tax=Arabidopsis suecica TaxID=45249 RepID=A0A8T1ZY80_ARASU|nr:NYN domain limkain-b1-type [Arabidopsis suecica]